MADWFSCFVGFVLVRLLFVLLVWRCSRSGRGPGSGKRVVCTISISSSSSSSSSCCCCFVIIIIATIIMMCCLFEHLSCYHLLDFVLGGDVVRRGEVLVWGNLLLFVAILCLRVVFMCYCDDWLLCVMCAVFLYVCVIMLYVCVIVFICYCVYCICVLLFSFIVCCFVWFGDVVCQAEVLRKAATRSIIGS